MYRAAEARAHGSLGYVYELLKNTDKAIDHLEQVTIFRALTIKRHTYLEW